MRYDWKEDLPAEPGTLEYFHAIDQRFFSAADFCARKGPQPFDRFLDFPSLRNADVLEIGVGHGSHAQLLATHARSFTGIDLTEKASGMTRQRFKLLGIPGRIERMDAEKMQFADGSFDFIWSWGVIHHSANTRAILKEMHRTLRPNGKAVVMVYYRSFWKYWVECALVRGLLKGEWLKYRSLSRILQESTDGALARFYTFSEFAKECDGLFKTEFSVCGQKPELVLLPPGKFKNFILKSLPDPVARFFLSRLRFGSFLMAELTRI